MTTPPKGRPNTSSQLSTQITQKRPLSPESSQFTKVKGRKNKNTKKKLSAESSIGDNHNSSDDENISDLAYMHKIITGKKTLTKKDFVKKTTNTIIDTNKSNHLTLYTLDTLTIRTKTLTTLITLRMLGYYTPVFPPLQPLCYGTSLRSSLLHLPIYSTTLQSSPAPSYTSPLRCKHLNK